MTRILIAEDEERIVAFLEKGLRSAGHTTVAVDNGVDAAALARDDSFDLVVLDLGLPGLGGLEVLAAVRGRGETLPVIVLTARSDLEATIGSLDGGADDYLAKPFRFEELLARIRLRLREPRTVGTASELSAAGLTLDLRTREITSASKGSAALTGREFALMETFLRNPERILSRAELLSSAWGYDFDPNSNVVDVCVRALRAKLPDGAIETVRGSGYRLRA